MFRIARCLGVVGAVLALSACGSPPDREIQQAQGAIDAARAAGADQYAGEEIAAAQAVLQRADEAVAVGDYRLALNHALHSRERAQNAALFAAEGRAAARVNADHAVSRLTDALAAARQALEAGERRAPARAIASQRSAIAEGEKHLQEARSVFENGEYRAVALAAVAAADELETVTRELVGATRPSGRGR